MNLEDVRLSYEYMDWANESLVSMLGAAFGEEADLRQTGNPLMLAIQEAVTHIVASQLAWRLRWEGVSPTSMLDPAEYPTLLALRREYEAERARFWNFFAALENEEALQRIVHATNTKGESRVFPLWQMMQHVVNHASYHRGQVTARLIDLGKEESIQPTDLTVFFLQHKS